MRTLRSKVLIIEDDPGICRFLRVALISNGYDAIETDSGAKALEVISSHCPDLILLDLGLPDMDGNAIIESVRSWTRTPIIVISARSMEEDKARALDLGADDYLTKPFGTIELLARIRTALRHTRTTAGDDGLALSGVYRVGDLTIDYARHRVVRGEQEIRLTPNEFRIVALLGKHAGRVVTYKSMLRELWGPMASSDNKILRVHMASIRRKIEPNPDEPIYIFTETGVGYRMADGRQADGDPQNKGGAS